MMARVLPFLSRSGMLAALVLRLGDVREYDNGLVKAGVET